YLKNLQKTRMRRLKIKQLLLLLLRMLIVILVVAAFARPTIRSGYTAGLGAAAKTSAVIMLDNSLSMSAETRNGSLFEQGRDFAAELLQILGDGDEVLFGTFNKDLEPAGDAFTLDFANASKLIGRSDQSSLTTDPQNSLASALEHAGRSGNLNREVYVISDFSEYGWDNLSGERFTDPPEGTGLYLVPIVDRDPDNVKVTGIDFGRQLIYPDRPVEIGVQLTNDNKRVSGVLTSLFVDGIRVSQAGCDIDAYSDGQISFKHTFEEQGLHHGFVELPDDAILADNKFYFSLSIPRRINVLIVGESERDNLYLKLAVRPRADGPTQIELKSIGLASLSGEDLFRFDCVILSGIDYMSEAAFSAVDNFASSGGGLLIFVPPTADSRFYSSRILKKRFAGDIAGIGEVSEGKGFFLLERLMMTH
ncbi:MAG: VWA domain-containing protein, partial [candidate division Zixibacteria bacterium]|nr:VWA domain-containing protein [candidate division Zixibacteria bacterium]